MLGGLETGLNSPLQSPWGVRKSLGVLPYDHFLVTVSKGPLSSNCMLQTTKTEHYFEFSEILKNTLLTQIFEKRGKK